MKLRMIAEVNWKKARRRMDPLLSKMPKKKREHSKRVGKMLHQLGAGKKAIYTGILHDFLERGGKLKKLAATIADLGLPEEIVDAVQTMSQDEEYGSSNEPLTHLKSELRKINDRELRNVIILAKLCDRIDNMRQRLDNGEMTKLYRNKSNELVEYLISQYTGKGRPLNKLLRKFREVTDA